MRKRTSRQSVLCLYIWPERGEACPEAGLRTEIQWGNNIEGNNENKETTQCQ
ncbi:hypothetical protein [Xenorhabdus sp. IM139775]|uniref:hypothetical protein n=1 Tax=Xenorhabdus sp. IM139775 TaxID=3025876 RepID=UPI002358BAE9|nr:hypothetical protein [Xenorhabdus sp. IM139775]MDC9594714.1 hypothetical protein [Xenorhabdus sp. IM139775]